MSSVEADKELEDIVKEMYNKEKETVYEFATVEELLMIMLKYPTTQKTLLALNGDLNKLNENLVEHLKNHVPVLPDGGKIEPTEELDEVLQRAFITCQSAGRTKVNVLDVLAAITAVSPRKCYANYFLRKQDITRLAVTNYISHGGRAPENEMAGVGEEDPNVPNPLRTFSINLNERAAKGKIDSLVGRDEEVERVVQILSRRKKNNPLLVGEPGVGKTAVVEGLAKRITEGNVPDSLKNSTVYALDLGALVAGTKYRGEFEQRFKNVIDKVEGNPNAILFIDEIHTLIGAGASGGGSMDAANLLKPALANGLIRMIGATTHDEKRTHLDKDKALSRRFQSVDINEPSPEISIEILHGLKAGYEKHHGVKYEDKAIEQAVLLSIRHLTDRRLPDKAIDILDEAGSREAIKPVGERKRIVTSKEIEHVIAQMARIPAKKVEGSDKTRLMNLDSDLKKSVFGQPQAIETISRAIKKSRAGIGAGGKTRPMGAFLFAGPTGVGKTEVAKQLAASLGNKFLRFDMSEYMEPHSVSKLIGSPPGYVGYEKSGLLTEDVQKNPYSIVLLDEIEKAHPDILNVFLQVMDNGFLTDAHGRAIDFRNTIVIMTSNVGVEEAEKATIGFSSPTAQSESNRTAAINKAFSPEFRNRLDKIVVFNSLTPEMMIHIVEKHLNVLDADLTSKQVVVNWDDSLKQWLAKTGFDPKMGARPLGRLIEDKVVFPLSEKILFGDLEFGGEVNVGLSSADEISVEVVRSNPTPVKEAETSVKNTATEEKKRILKP